MGRHRTRAAAAMDRNILFKCPTTGMNVQHSLSGDAAGSVETHVMVCAPPARRCIWWMPPRAGCSAIEAVRLRRGAGARRRIGARPDRSRPLRAAGKQVPSSVVNRRVDRAPAAFRECAVRIADVVAQHRHFMSSALGPGGNSRGQIATAKDRRPPGAGTDRRRRHDLSGY
jgi:hypothetical protein